MSVNIPIRYKRGYDYHLLADAVFYTGIRPDHDIVADFYEIRTTGVIIAKKGYAWDGSTGVPDTRYCMAASLLHDIICQAVQEGRLHKRWKLTGDFEYYALSRRNGMWPPRASIRLLGLQFHDWTTTRDRPVLTAPNVQEIPASNGG